MTVHAVQAPVPCGRSICMWCKTDYGAKPGLPAGQLSHGACPGCCALCGNKKDPESPYSFCDACRREFNLMNEVEGNVRERKKTYAEQRTEQDQLSAAGRGLEEYLAR